MTRGGGVASASMVATLPVNLHEYEPLARAGMSPMAWDYLAGGGGDERALAWNRERLDATRLSPRVLHDVSDVDMRLSLLGVERSEEHTSELQSHSFISYA